MSREEFLREEHRLNEIKLSIREDNGVRKWFCMSCYVYLGEDISKIPIVSHVLGTYCGKECWEKAKKDFVNFIKQLC